MKKHERGVDAVPWWLLVLLGIFWALTMESICFGAGPFGQWRQSDPMCTPGGNCCPPDQQSYQAAPRLQVGSQYVPAAPPSVAGEYPAALASPGILDCPILKSTVWVTPLSPDGKHHWHGTGNVIAVDDTRGARRVLILTYVCTRGDVSNVGFSKDDPGIAADELAADRQVTGLRLIEIIRDVKPTWHIPFDPKPPRNGDQVFRDGWSPVVSHSPQSFTVCKVAPVVMKGAITGYRGTKLLADMPLREGLAGSPIFRDAGMVGMTVPSGRPDSVWAIPASVILEWIGTTRVNLTGAKYTLSEMTTGPMVVLPGPEEEPEDDPLDVVVPLPGEFEEDPKPKEDDDEIMLLLTEISNNVQGITTKLDDLVTRVDALEMGYDLLEKKCKDGSQGLPGSSPTAAEVAEVLSGDNAFLAKVAALVPVVPFMPPTTETHLILVRDEGAEYWPRMADELKRAREGFSGIREVDPPSFATPMPRLIGYDGGVPVLDVQGVRDVSDSLLAIAEGEFSFPGKER